MSSGEDADHGPPIDSANAVRDKIIEEVMKRREHTMEGTSSRVCKSNQARCDAWNEVAQVLKENFPGKNWDPSKVKDSFRHIQVRIKKLASAIHEYHTRTGGGRDLAEEAELKRREELLSQQESLLLSYCKAAPSTSGILEHGGDSVSMASSSLSSVQHTPIPIRSSTPMAGDGSIPVPIEITDSPPRSSGQTTFESMALDARNKENTAKKATVSSGFSLPKASNPPNAHLQQREKAASEKKIRDLTASLLSEQILAFKASRAKDLAIMEYVQTSTRLLTSGQPMAGGILTLPSTASPGQIHNLLPIVPHDVDPNLSQSLLDLDTSTTQFFPIVPHCADPNLSASLVENEPNSNATPVVPHLADPNLSDTLFESDDGL